MPVVIEDLEISVSVQNDTNTRGAAAGSSGAASDSPDMKKKIIEECLEKVMDVLNHQNER